jgi:hypothetical protein
LVAPLFDMQRLRRRVVRILSRLSRPTAIQASADERDEEERANAVVGIDERGRPLGRAAAMDRATTTPLRCSHVACYWCVEAERNAGGGICGICAADIV